MFIAPPRTDVVPARAKYMRSPQKVVSEVKELVSRYPAQARSVVLGYSVERRPIIGLVVGVDPLNKKIPRIAFTAGVHGRETANAPLLTDWATNLLAKAATGDSIRGAMLAQRTLLLIPQVNPDAAAQVWEGLRLGDAEKVWKRTNMRSGGGVDLNRNFSGPTWGAGSSDEGSSNYRGPAPASEPETKAVESFLTKWRPAAVYDIHSPGSVVLVANPRAGVASALEAGKLVAKHTGYALSASDDYWQKKVGGTIKDWASDVLKVPALTIETGTSHHQNDAEFADTKRRMFPAMDALVQAVNGEQLLEV